jgi:hypothetical protein
LKESIRGDRGAMSTHQDAFLEELHHSKRKRGRETKRKLFSLIEESEPKGLTLGELVKATKKIFPPKGLHRDRVADICKEYITGGLLKQEPKEKGKFGWYHLGPNAYGDPRLAAFYLQREIMDPDFFRLGKEAICFSSEFSIYHGKKQLLLSPQYKDYLESSNENEALDKLYMFEYSLKLGAILVYQLIQAIRYAEATPLLSSFQKDDFVLKWIENAVMPMPLVQTFRRLLPVYKRLAKPKQVENLQEAESMGWLELEKGEIEGLANIFRNTFGGSFLQKLEGIRSASIPRDLSEHKHRISESERIEQLRKEDPDHIKCGGVADPLAIKRLGVISSSEGQTVNLYSTGKDYQPIKRCSRCGRRIVMKWMVPVKPTYL